MFLTKYVHVTRNEHKYVELKWVPFSILRRPIIARSQTRSDIDYFFSIKSRGLPESYGRESRDFTL